LELYEKGTLGDGVIVDILVLADGTVKKRKGGLLMFDGHEIRTESRRN
jgi:hypothetical protein